MDLATSFRPLTQAKARAKECTLVKTVVAGLITMDINRIVAIVVGLVVVGYGLILAISNP